MSMVYKRCIEPDCKRIFYIREEDQKFFITKLVKDPITGKDVPMELPRRCWNCRKKRKENYTAVVSFWKED